ncbi:MAG: helix-turn-helix transcriptional regulator [Bacteroidetes bacterium]|uniref:Helix-turn-helix transcriptional regulator n=1 Tax=Candidatus Merdivivens pullistercoris TaxID=2840873 RepID=A0A9D9N976_9BACT|nr:helix-turn-helix transcriptional regulator [Candidatus Merdivivens pullistercoris]
MIERKQILFYRTLMIQSLFLFAVFIPFEAEAFSGRCYTAELDSFRAVWNEYNKEGRYTDLVDDTREYFHASLDNKDTTAFLYSGITMSMAFLSLEEPDSVSKYMDAVSPFISVNTDPRMLLTYNFVRGTYSLKRDYNYPLALDYYQKCHDIAKKSGDVDNSIAALLNIVHIYYVRSDKRGLGYAVDAFNLSHSPGTDSLAVCMANIAMGEMLFLSDSLDSALAYSEEALRLAWESGYESVYSDLHLLLADIYAGMDSSSVGGAAADKARKHYDEAIAYSANAEAGTLTMLYLHYGRFAERKGMMDKAISLYHKGLEISLESGNMEFRRELYRRVADLSYSEGRMKEALDFYKSYAFLIDSVASQSMEFRFDSLLLANQNMAHREDMNLKEIELLKANRNNLMIASIMVLAVFTAFFIWVMYRRQKNMYKVLFDRYRNYAARFNAGSSAQYDSGQVVKSLFSRLEDKMNEEKLYRRKDISVEKVSEILGTNRTYLSKAVNKCAGISFPAYVNSYRIKEAADIISQHGDQVQLKVLAEELGFNSVSVFIKVFQKETGLTPARYKKEMNSSKMGGEDL